MRSSIAQHSPRAHALASDCTWPRRNCSLEISRGFRISIKHVAISFCLRVEAQRVLITVCHVRSLETRENFSLISLVLFLLYLDHRRWQSEWRRAWCTPPSLSQPQSPALWRKLNDQAQSLKHSLLTLVRMWRHRSDCWQAPRTQCTQSWWRGSTAPCPRSSSPSQSLSRSWSGSSAHRSLQSQSPVAGHIKVS